MPDFLLYDQQGPVVTLTMNEPDRRNPLTGNSAVHDFRRPSTASKTTAACAR